MYKSIIAAICVSAVSIPAIAASDIYGSVYDPHIWNGGNLTSPRIKASGSGDWSVSRTETNQVGRYSITFDIPRINTPIVVASGLDNVFPDKTSDNIVTVIKVSRFGFGVVIMDVCGQLPSYPHSCNTGNSPETGLQGGRFSFIVK